MKIQSNMMRNDISQNVDTSTSAVVKEFNDGYEDYQKYLMIAKGKKKKSSNDNSSNEETKPSPKKPVGTIIPKLKPQLPPEVQQWQECSGDLGCM